MSGLEFRIKHPDGRSERLVVDSDRVLIGSGAHCEIRLPSAESAVEQVRVTATAGAVHLEARALAPPPTLNGAPFAEAPYLAESILGVGKVEIVIAVVEVEGAANVIKKKQEKTSPLTYVLALIAVPISLYILLDDPPKDTPGSGKPKDVPELFAQAAPSCPHRAADQALGFARERRVLAEGKRERGPFHVKDGVAAVPLFRLAAACYRAGSEGALAKEMDSAADKLKKSLEEDYRAHQMRLDHAILVRDLRTAQKEVKVLRAMLDGRDGAYVTWLSNLDRRLAVKLGKVGS